jgi:dienelactone hydrolase
MQRRRAIEKLDLEAAVQFVDNANLAAHVRIGALGFSVGATTVAMTTAHNMRIEAIVLDCGPALP